MNWARVKTIFIVLLVVCNAIVFYVYTEGENVYTESKYSEEQLISQIISKLDKEGVKLEGVQVPQIKVVPSLKVSDQELSFKDEKQRFADLGLYSYSEASQDGYLFTYNLDSSLDIAYYGDLAKIKPSNYDTAFQTANKFTKTTLKDINFEYYNYEALENGNFKIYFEESFKGIRILDGYMIAEIRGDKLVSLKQKIVEIEEDEAKKQKLIDYSEVLYKFYSMISEQEKNIQIDSINIVEELIKKDQKDNLISGEAFVYYRFLSTDGKVYMIDATDNKDK